MRKRILLGILVPIMTAVALVLGVAPAQAEHSGPFIFNSDTQLHWGRIISHTGWLSWYNGNPGNYIGGTPTSGPRGFDGFDAPTARSRWLYESKVTGTLYWSGCTEDLAWFAVDTNQGQKRAVPIGNSVEIIKHVTYPTAPANVC